VHPHSFETPEGEGPVLLLVAARVAGVRLIDNLLAHPGQS
jgi:pantothenate synthetase